MIFVTVGTHEQPFNRLIVSVDKLKQRGIIKDEVIIQAGSCTYIPEFCKCRKMLPYPEMEKNVAEARIVISHGGPASFIMPLRMGKIPIVVPRCPIYGEHVNNHQTEFIEAVNERMGNVIPVYDIAGLEYAILHYDSIVRGMNAGMESSNENFCRRFEEIVEGLGKESR